MITCPKCGTENPERAKFCLECASPLASDQTRSAGTRKLVTILFADVVGSTALGEQLDPETLRGLLARYFSTARIILERHGATIEKFIGDAVMAVFGIPQVHEDDALRAVRAALELRDAIDKLNAQLAAERRMRVEFRIGVNTGEVVAGAGSNQSTLVTGDAVNTAARLEQAAPPGQILIGEPTLQLVRDFVQVEQAPPVDAKGKSQPVAAFRLLRLAMDVPQRPAAPFVGRERELKRLLQAFEDARAEQRCYLFTLLGSAGVGKSRLVGEFVDRVAGQANVVRGRCLPYGEGITYWPIGEIVRSIAGIAESDDAAAARARLAATLPDMADDERIAELVASAVGLSDTSAPREETFWAIRRWLEVRAAGSGLVCIVEDIHWAEQTLLDLLEHLADWTRDAAILLLCTARPEFLETSPTWGGGKVNSTTLLLEPLSADTTRELVETLTAGREMPAGVVRRILDTAEGNPLFAEEIVRMLLEQDPVAAERTSEVRIPTSVQAVIAARLDRLPPRERSVAERAAVAGRVFERGAVLALVPESERDEVPRHLLSLVRKELVHPDRAELTPDEAFRFRHLLIRDTAYEALPKQERAELHERFAQWVEQVAGDRALEYGEVIGYHYEQAHRYRRELGLDDPATADLARRAGDQLVAAGRRAYARRDAPAAAKLLARAVALMEPGADRVGALVLLGLAGLDHAHFPETLAVARRLQAEAGPTDSGAHWKGRLLEHIARTWTDPQTDTAVGEEMAYEAIRVFEHDGDRHGLAIAYAALGDVHLGRARWATAKEVNELGARFAAGIDPVLEEHHRNQVVNAAIWGPTPVAEFLVLVDVELERTRSEFGRSHLLALRALGHAMAGQAVEARADKEAVFDLRTQLGQRRAMFTGGLVEYILGDLDAADEAYAETSLYYEEKGETGARSTVAALWALCKFDLGRPEDEVMDLVRLSRELGAADDAITQLSWRQVAALVAARSGRADEASRLIDEATAIADKTDALHSLGLVARDRGRIAEMLGDRASAGAHYQQALAYLERKGDVSDAARVRADLERLSELAQ